MENLHRYKQSLVRILCGLCIFAMAAVIPAPAQLAGGGTVSTFTGTHWSISGSMSEEGVPVPQAFFVDGGGLRLPSLLIDGSGSLVVNGGTLSLGADDPDAGSGMLEISSAFTGKIVFNNDLVFEKGIRVGGGTTATGTIAINGSYAGGRISVGAHDALFNGVFTARNVTIAGQAAPNGGALKNNSAHTELLTAVFASNTASNLGGGAILNEAGLLKLSGATFTGNISENGGGGAIFNNTGAVLSGSDLAFDANSARVTTNTSFTAGAGGAITNDNGSVTLSGATFTNNTAATAGGAIFSLLDADAIQNQAALTLENVLFDGNRAGEGGGAIATGVLPSGSSLISTDIPAAPTLVITNGTFSNNVSGFNGGALATMNDNAVLTNVIFTSNTAAGLGGAITHDSGALTIAVTKGKTLSYAGNAALGGAAAGPAAAAGGFLHLDYGASAAFDIAAGASLTIGAAADGDGALDSIAGTYGTRIAKNGGGLLALNADNSGYYGALAINGGTLALGRANNISGISSLSLADGAVVLSAGLDQAVYDLRSAANASGARIALDGATLTIGGGDFAGVIEGSLLKETENTYAARNIESIGSGAIIDGGAIALRGIAAYDGTSGTKTVVINNAAWLDMADTDYAAGAASWAGLVITDNTAGVGGIITAADGIEIDNSGAATIDPGAAKGSFVVIKPGDNGTVELTGDNNYAGYTRIDSGTLAVTDNGQIGDAALAREIVLNGGDLQIADGVDADGRNIEARQDGAVNVGAGSTTWNSLVADTGTAALTLTKTGLGDLNLEGDAFIGSGTLAVAEGALNVAGVTIAQTLAIAGGAEASLDGGALLDNALIDGAAQFNADATVLGQIVTGSSATVAIEGDSTLIVNGGTLAADLHGTGTLAVAAGNLFAQAIEGSLATAAGAAANVTTIEGNIDNKGTLNVAGSLGAAPPVTAPGVRALNAAANGNSIANDGLINFTGASGGAIYAAAFVNMASGTVANLREVAMTRVENLGRITLASGAATFHQGLSGTGGRVDFAAFSNAAAGDTLAINDGLAGSQTFGNVRINFADASKNNTITIAGGATGAHQISLVHDQSGGWAANPESYAQAVVGIDSGDATFASNTLDSGMFSFALKQGDGTALTPDSATWYLAYAGISADAGPILASAGVLGLNWNYSLDSVYLRLGDLRALSSAFFAQPGDTAARPAPAGNVWVRANAYRLNSSVGGFAFEQNTYGVSAGADKAFVLGNGTAALLAGGFLQMGNSDRDHGPERESETGEFSAGAYATYVMREGWYVDGVLKYGRFKNDLSMRAADGRMTDIEYTNAAVGFSAEAGRRFESGNFWVEPSLQAGIALFNSAGYDLTSGIRIDIERATVMQYRGQIRSGAVFGQWRPYVKIGMVRADSNGGEVRAQGRSYVADFDGMRFEAGGGVSYAINAKSQVYLDYEYSRADNYERPWAVNAGYLLAW